MIINSATILLMLRNGEVNDWHTLAKAFGLNSEVMGTFTGELLNNLFSLREAGLVEFAVAESEFSPPPGEIRLTEHWNRIQAALRLSLRELSKLHGDALVVSPLFGRPTAPPVVPNVFVLMPFQENLKPVYDDHIRLIVSHLGLSVARGDDFFATRSVISDIWAAIHSAKILVADCTGRNPNVFYELGIAHTLGKPVVLITQNTEDIPFDLRHIRVIEYAYTPRGMIAFEKKLAETLRAELGIGSDSKS